MVTVRGLECGPVATNAWVACNSSIHLAFCVDVPPNSHDAILQVLEEQKCRLTDILLTHTHWDHVADCAALARTTGAPVTVHALDAYRLIEPDRHTVWPLPFHIESVIPSVVLSNETEISAAGIRLKVLHTPGHTEGGVCFVDEVSTRVFVGDTLFAGSVGRTDLPGGNMEQLLESIQSKLLTLPGEMTVFPGHGPTTTIETERTSNPFLIL